MQKKAFPPFGPQEDVSVLELLWAIDERGAEVDKNDYDTLLLTKSFYAYFSTLKTNYEVE